MMKKIILLPHFNHSSFVGVVGALEVKVEVGTKLVIIHMPLDQLPPSQSIPGLNTTMTSMKLRELEESGLRLDVKAL